MMHQLYEWYLQLWPNIVAAPITAVLAWGLHKLTTHKDLKKHITSEIKRIIGNGV